MSVIRYAGGFPAMLLVHQSAMWIPMLMFAGKLTETQVLLSHADKLHLDRYGFIVTLEEAATRAARAKRTSAQARREQRHVQKWRHMLGSCREDFVAYWASKAKKVKRRVRKGIPDEFRGLVWQYLSGRCGSQVSSGVLMSFGQAVPKTGVKLYGAEFCASSSAISG